MDSFFDFLYVNREKVGEGVDELDKELDVDAWKKVDEAIGRTFAADPAGEKVERAQWA